MRKSALTLALSQKLTAKEARVIYGLGDVKKTSEADSLLTVLKINGKVLIVLEKENKFYKNIKNAKVLNYKNLNALEVIKAKNILIDSKVFTKKNEN